MEKLLSLSRENSFSGYLAVPLVGTRARAPCHLGVPRAMSFGGTMKYFYYLYPHKEGKPDGGANTPISVKGE